MAISLQAHVLVVANSLITSASVSPNGSWHLAGRWRHPTRLHSLPFSYFPNSLLLSPSPFSFYSALRCRLNISISSSNLGHGHPFESNNIIFYTSSAAYTTSIHLAIHRLISIHVFSTDWHWRSGASQLASSVHLSFISSGREGGRNKWMDG